jgi:hypothetical protein
LVTPSTFPFDCPERHLSGAFLTLCKLRGLSWDRARFTIIFLPILQGTLGGVEQLSPVVATDSHELPAGIVPEREPFGGEELCENFIGFVVVEVLNSGCGVIYAWISGMNFSDIV